MRSNAHCIMIAVLLNFCIKTAGAFCIRRWILNTIQWTCLVWQESRMILCMFARVPNWNLNAFTWFSTMQLFKSLCMCACMVVSNLQKIKKKFNEMNISFSFDDHRQIRIDIYKWYEQHLHIQFDLRSCSYSIRNIQF